MDWAEVTRYYAKEFTESGGDVYLDFKVSGFDTVAEGDNVDKDVSNYPVRIRSKDKVN